MLPQPCVLVIFGAAGTELAQANAGGYNLNGGRVLPSNFAVVGFGLGAEGDSDEWIRQRAATARPGISRRPPEDNHWQHFARSLFY